MVSDVWRPCALRITAQSTFVQYYSVGYLVLIEVFSPLAVPPTILAVEDFVTVIEGSEGRLSCMATGDPFPVYTWTRNGAEIDGTGDQFALESDGAVLIVRSVSVENEGAYQCQASNIAGRATDSITLNVIGTVAM